MLALFDVDGTLLQGSESAHFASMNAALMRVFRLRKIIDTDVPKSGRTDFEIAREVAQLNAVAGAEFEMKLPDLTSFWLEELQKLDIDFSGLLVPGIKDLLLDLRECRVVSTLVTGNLAPLAAYKVSSAGIADLLNLNVGGYGSDAEDRRLLPPVARKRAHNLGLPSARGQTVLIGDTPRDIICAHADGLRCIAVTTGPYGEDELGDAEWIARDSVELKAALTEASIGSVRPHR